MLSRELLVDGFSACHQSPLLGSPLLLLPGLSPWLSRGGQAVPGEWGSQRGTLLPALRSLLLMLLLLSILWSPPSFLFLLLLGLILALGAWLAQREEPSPWWTPEACALVVNHR